MLKIKTKMSDEFDNFDIMYKAKATNTLEHIFLMAYLCKAILRNDDEITMNEIWEYVKEMKNDIDSKEQE